MKKETGKKSVSGLLRAKPRRKEDVEISKQDEEELKSVMEAIKLFSKNQRLSLEISAQFVVENRKLGLPFVHLNAGFDAKSFLMSGSNVGIFIDKSGGIRESVNHSIHGLIGFWGGKDVEDDLTVEMKNDFLENKHSFDKYAITFSWFGEVKRIIYYVKEPSEYFGKIQEIRNGIGMLALYNTTFQPAVGAYLDKVAKGGLVLHKGKLYVDPSNMGLEKLNEFFYDDGTQDSSYYGILRKVSEVKLNSVENWLRLNEAISALVFIKHERDEEVKTRLSIGKYQTELIQVDEAMEKIRQTAHRLGRNEKESLRKTVEEFILKQKVEYGGRLEQNLRALVSYAKMKLSEVDLTD